MKALAILLCTLGLLVPAAAVAHPHIWISQQVRVVGKDGKLTHVELEWRFDPSASEIEIPLIDENGDGKISPAEAKALVGDMMKELESSGYMTWLNTGDKDFRPPKRPTFSARIDDPASFVPPYWDKAAGDAGMPMPENKRANEPPVPRKRGPRTLVYIMRFELPKPVPSISIVTYDPEDFIRIEVDKKAVPAGCTLGQNPKHKAEFVRGYPVFAGVVSCRSP